MFGTASSSPTLTTTATTTAAAAPVLSPTSPTRPSRLRGLSYLRNYTHNHLHSREPSSASASAAAGASSSSRPNVARATSYPSPTGSPIVRSGTDVTPVQSPGPPASHRLSAIFSSANPLDESPVVGSFALLPSGRGQSGVSRILSPPHSIATSNPSAILGTAFDDASRSMGRSRHSALFRTTDMAPAPAPAPPAPAELVQEASSQPTVAGQAQSAAASSPSIRFSQHQDVRAPRPSLIFTPMHRTLPSHKDIIRVGRYSERDQVANLPYNVPSAAPVGFKSKVVSRRHCEFWSQDGNWFIKDVKSSSGTFLNHVRLSPPGQESKPFAVKDGDIVQLGIDFKGGEEMIFRCVKIRVELNRNWQNALNTFNVASHKRLRKMAQQNASAPGSSQDCSICLGPVAPCQALFVAPCSHTWHYKCVRRILNGPMWPQFICPNCRAVADLEAEVDEPYDDGDWEEVDAEQAPEQPQGTAATASVPDPVAAPRSSEEPEMVLDEEAEHHTRFLDEGVAAVSTDESDEDINTAQDALSNMRLGSPPLGEASSTPVPTATSNNATSPAMFIPQSRHGSTSRGSREGGVNPPSSSGRYRAPGVVDLNIQSHTGDGPEGPMTPRNDAGPFVFDGSAGRISEAGLLALANHSDDVASSIDTVAAHAAGGSAADAAAAAVVDEHEREGHPL